MEKKGVGKIVFGKNMLKCFEKFVYEKWWEIDKIDVNCFKKNPEFFQKNPGNFLILPYKAL